MENGLVLEKYLDKLALRAAGLIDGRRMSLNLQVAASELFKSEIWRQFGINK